MFERFVKQVREIVAQAEREARLLDAPAVGTEHLLLALVDRHPMLLLPDAASWEVAVIACGNAERGWGPPDHAEALRALIERDARDALAAIGISLDEVRARIEAESGEAAWHDAAAGDRRPFNREAREALELALRTAQDWRTRRIGPLELLVALLRQNGRATALVRELGVDPAAVETRLVAMTQNLLALAGRER